jgi:hypothetical protein
MAQKVTQEIPTKQLVGRKWQVILNGRRSLNGPRHSLEINGDVQQAPNPVTIYELAQEIIAAAQATAPEMEYPDSIQLTVFPR